jgi:hypothetical protein
VLLTKKEDTMGELIFGLIVLDGYAIEGHLIVERPTDP